MSAKIIKHYFQPSLLPAVDKGNSSQSLSRVTEDAPPGKHVQRWHMKPLPLRQWLWLGKCHHGSHGAVQLLVESHGSSSANQLQAIGNDMSHCCRKQHSTSWAHSSTFSSTKHHRSWVFSTNLTCGHKSPGSLPSLRFSEGFHDSYLNIMWNEKKKKNNTQKHSDCSRFWGISTEFYKLSPCRRINKVS